MYDIADYYLVSALVDCIAIWSKLEMLLLRLLVILLSLNLSFGQFINDERGDCFYGLIPPNHLAELER